MGRPPILPDSGTLRQLRVDGKSNQDIAIMYGVSKSAVDAAFRRYKLARPRPDHSAVLPWTMRLEHTHLYPAVMLRRLARRLAGLPLTDEQSAGLDRWLAERKANGEAVAYEADRGWFYVAAQPTDIAGVVRPPDRSE